MTQIPDNNITLTNANNLVSFKQNTFRVRLLLFIWLLSFLAIFLVLVIRPNTKTQSPQRQANQEKSTKIITSLQKEKYTKEYFEQAQKENRELNEEEMFAYTKLRLNKNTILGALFNNEQFKCMLEETNDYEKNISIQIYVKNNQLKVAYKSQKTKADILVTKTDYYAWTTDRSELPLHETLKTELQRLEFLSVSLWDKAEDQELYRSSCSKEIIDDSNFIVPNDINFMKLDEYMKKASERSQQ